MQIMFAKKKDPLISVQGATEH